jgi:hypothetical protein
VKNVPVSFIKKIDDSLYIGTNGSGIYQFNEGLVEYKSRFTTHLGIDYGNWVITDIAEEKTNRKKVYVGTKDHGVLTTNNVNDGENTIWRFDNNGIPSGEVTGIKILDVNNTIVLVGIKDNGLFRKNNNTGIYEKITNGLPENGNVKEIIVSSDSPEIFIMFKVNYEITGNVVVFRSPYTPMTFIPDDGVIYSVGEEVYGADVIYKGNWGFNQNIFKDTSKKLRNGIPYYYTIYNYDENYKYTECGVINGPVRGKDGMIFNVDDNVFAGKVLSGRIVDLAYNSINPQPQKYKIIENNDQSFTVEFDEFKEINNCGWQGLYNNKAFRIGSTIVEKATVIYPIFMVYQKDDDSSVYESYDNGSTWVKTNI